MRLTGPILYLDAPADRDGDRFATPLLLSDATGNSVTVTSTWGEGDEARPQTHEGLSVPLCGTARATRDTPLGQLKALRTVTSAEMKGVTILEADVEVDPAFEAGIRNALSYIAAHLCVRGNVIRENEQAVEAMTLRALDLGLNTGQKMDSARIVEDVEFTKAEPEDSVTEEPSTAAEATK